MVDLLVVGIVRVFEGLKNNLGSKMNGGKSDKIHLKEKRTGCVISEWLIIKVKNSKKQGPWQRSLKSKVIFILNFTKLKSAADTECLKCKQIQLYFFFNS